MNEKRISEQNSQAWAPIPSFNFASGPLKPPEAFEIWRTLLGEFYEVEPIEDINSAFAANMTTWNLGGALFSQGTFTGQRFSRTARRARRDGFDAYAVMMYRRGRWRADAGGLEVECAARRVNLLDFARPLSAEVTTNDSITVGIPREFLEEVVRPRDVHGLALEGAAGSLLYDFLLSVGDRIASLAAHEAPHVAAAVRDLLAACLQPSPATAERARPQIDAIAFRRAQALIESNLHRPDWGAEELRLAMGVSRSTQYRIFEHAGGVAEQIRTQRLARAHKMLSRSDGLCRVYKVADKCGFINEAHFSRAFRKAYGYSAREAIGIGSDPSPVQPRAAPTKRQGKAEIVDWIRRLRA